MKHYLFVIYPALSFTLSYLFITAMLKTPFAQFFADTPDARKIHEKPVPRIGGMCIIAAFIIVLHLYHALSLPGSGVLNPQLYYSILGCVFALFFIGFLDDSTFFTVRIRYKLIVEFSVAIAAVIALHLRFGHITLISGADIPFWMNDLVAVLWIVGVINALNIIDGVNGLAGGIAILGFAGLAILGGEASSVNTVLLCLILAGATAGFLLHNVRPSRVFLGDTGSLFLGAMFGIVSLHVVNLSPASFSLPLCALFVGLPLLDVFVAMVRRYFRARDKQQPLPQRLHATVLPDNNHIHHRLITRGYSHLQTSVLLYAFSLMFCLGALAMQYVSAGLKIALALYLATAAGLILHRLGFGARFFRDARRQWQARTAHRKTAPAAVLGIIDNRGVIAHAVERAGISGALVDKITEDAIRIYGKRFAALAIYNSPQTPLPNDLNIARDFIKTFHRPAFVISEKVAADIRITDNSSEASIYCKKMPVSIDPLITEMLQTILPVSGNKQPAIAAAAIPQPIADLNPAANGIAS